MSPVARLITFLTCCAAPCLACDSWQRLPVKLFNDAAAANDLIRPAMREATWVLKTVCVAATWTFCPVITVSNQAPCEAPSGAVELHILVKPPTDDFHETTLGIAIPTLGDRSRAAVFLSRIRQLAATHGGIIEVSGLLGHVMAHELGHLLLRSSAHSSEGIMREDLGRAELRKAAQRQLKFTREQTEIIRRNALLAAR